MATSTFNAKTDITALTGTDFAKLTTADLGQLSKTQAALLTADQLSSLSATTLPAITGVLKYIATTELSGISLKAIAGLTLKGLTNDQIKALSVEQLGALSSTQVASMSKAQLGLLDGQADKVAVLNIAGVSDANLDILVNDLSVEQIAKLSSAQISSLSPLQVSSLTADQAAALTPAQAPFFKSFASMSIVDAASTDEALQAVDAKFIAALPAKLFSTLSTTQLEALSDTQVAVLTSSHIQSLTADKIAHLGHLGENVAVLSPSAIAGLTKTNINAFDFKLLSGDGQFAALTSVQLGALSNNQVEAITADQAGSLTSTQLSAISSTQVVHLSNDAIAALQPKVISALSPKALSVLGTGSTLLGEVSALTSDQTPYLTSAQIKVLSLTQLGKFTADEISVLSPAALAAIPSTAVSAIAPDVFSNLTIAQVAALTPAQFTNLSASVNGQLAHLTADQAVAITSAQIKGLNGASIGAFTSDALLGLKPATLAAISSTTIGSIPAATFSVFTTAQVAALTPAQFTNLSASASGQLAHFTADQAVAITSAQIKGLNGASIGAFTSDALLALKPATLAAISSTAIGSIPATTFSAFTSAQIAALTPTQFGELDHTAKTGQLAQMGSDQAVGITSAQIKKLDASDIASLSSDAIVSLSTTTLAAVEPSTFSQLTPTAFNALSSKQVAALTPAQCKQLTNNQMIQFGADQATGLTTAQFAKIQPEIVAAMSGDAFSALKPAIMQSVDFTNFTNTQVSYLSAQQGAALTSKQLNLLDASDLAGLDTDTLAAIKPDSFKGLKGSFVGSNSNETAAINGLSVDALSAITTTQLAALSTAQIESLQANKIQYLSDNAIAWLSSKGYTTVTNAGQTSGIRTSATVNSSDIASVITAGKKAVSINGSSHADSIIGSPSNDTITGGGGNDSIDAGAGNDTIVFTSASDLIDGGEGKDTLKIVGNATLGTDNNVINVEQITITASANVSLATQTEDFVITATDNSSHTIVAGLGNDTITGGSGTDTFAFIPAASVIGTNRDVITNYINDTDSLQFTNANGIAVSIALPSVDTSATVSGANVQVNNVGLVTFNSADSTLDKKIIAIEADEGLNAAGQVALFVSGADSYVYYSGASTSDYDDQIIKLAKTSGTGLGLGVQGTITSINELISNDTPLIPIFTSSQINGNEITLNYTNAKALDPATILKNSFTLYVNDGANGNESIASISINSELKTLTLTLDNPINLAEMDTATLTYLNPTNGNSISSAQFGLHDVINYGNLGTPYTAFVNTTDLIGVIDNTTELTAYTLIDSAGATKAYYLDKSNALIEYTYYIENSNNNLLSTSLKTHSFDSQKIITKVSTNTINYDLNKSILSTSEDQTIYNYNSSGYIYKISVKTVNYDKTSSESNEDITYDKNGNILVYKLINYNFDADNNKIGDNISELVNTYDSSGQILTSKQTNTQFDVNGNKIHTSIFEYGINNSFVSHSEIDGIKITKYDQNNTIIGISIDTTGLTGTIDNGTGLTAYKTTSSNTINIGIGSVTGITYISVPQTTDTTYYLNTKTSLLEEYKIVSRHSFTNSQSILQKHDSVNTYDSSGQQLTRKHTNTQFDINGNKIHTSIFEYGINNSFVSHSEIDGIKITKYDQNNTIIGTSIDTTGLTGILDSETGLTAYKTESSSTINIGIGSATGITYISVPQTTNTTYYLNTLTSLLEKYEVVYRHSFTDSQSILQKHESVNTYDSSSKLLKSKQTNTSFDINGNKIHTSIFEYGINNSFVSHSEIDGIKITKYDQNNTIIGTSIDTTGLTGILDSETGLTAYKTESSSTINIGIGSATGITYISVPQTTNTTYYLNTLTSLLEKYEVVYRHSFTDSQSILQKHESVNTYDSSSKLLKSKQTNTSFDINGNIIGSNTNNMISETYDSSGRQLTYKSESTSFDSSGNKIGSGTSDSVNTYDSSGQQLTRKYTNTQFDINGNKIHTSIFEYGINNSFVSHSEIDGIKITKYDQNNTIIGTSIDTTGLTGILDSETGLTAYKTESSSTINIGIDSENGITYISVPQTTNTTYYLNTKTSLLEEYEVVYRHSFTDSQSILQKHESVNTYDSSSKLLKSKQTNTSFDINGNIIGSNTNNMISETYDSSGRQLTYKSESTSFDSSGNKIGSGTSDSVNTYDSSGQQLTRKYTNTQFDINGNKIHTSIFEYGINNSFVSHSEIDGIKITKYDQNNTIIGTSIDTTGLTGILDSETGLTAYKTESSSTINIGIDSENGITYISVPQTTNTTYYLNTKTSLLEEYEVVYRHSFTDSQSILQKHESVNTYDSSGKQLTSKHTNTRFDVNGNKTHTSINNYDESGNHVSGGYENYDSSGNKTTNSTYTITLSYDENGRKITEIQNGINYFSNNKTGTYTSEINYTYDINGYSKSKDVYTEFDVNGNQIYTRITFVGTPSADSITGTSGLDIIEGLEGNDTVEGGEGNDDLFGGMDADKLDGGDGNDLLEGGSGDDSIIGGIGNDSLSGGDGADTLEGGEGNDELFGGMDADKLDGGDGNDSIDGGEGSDIIQGGVGDDFILGGESIDYMTGGQGNDTFEFNLLGVTLNTYETDVIVDFVSGKDRIGIITEFDYQLVSSSTDMINFNTLLAAVNKSNITDDDKILYYFGVIGENGYLVTENDDGVISNIIKLSGVTNIDTAIDILDIFVIT